jgi:hypothetical protein
MSAFGNPLSPRKRTGLSEVLTAIKSMTRETLCLGEDVHVSVSELKCYEPGCPDVETVIVVMKPGNPHVLFRIHKPVMSVTRDDVAHVIANRTPGSDES